VEHKTEECKKILLALEEQTRKYPAAEAAESKDEIVLPRIQAASVAAQQETAQVEASYQRKMVSLEGRCQDLINNNKRLLSKIQLLEESESQAKDTLHQVQENNEVLIEQVDSLKCTLTSQTNVILNLRDTLLKSQVKSSLYRILFFLTVFYSLKTIHFCSFCFCTKYNTER